MDVACAVLDVEPELRNISVLGLTVSASLSDDEDRVVVPVAKGVRVRGLTASETSDEERSDVPAGKGARERSLEVADRSDQECMQRPGRRGV